MFTKALARIDELQEETNVIRGSVATTQGQVQVNRENIGELEDLIRAAGGKISTSSAGGGTRAEISRLADDVSSVCCYFCSCGCWLEDRERKKGERKKKIEEK